MFKDESLAICVGTCRRPAGLKALVQSLSMMELPTRLAKPIHLVVVENDDSGSAAEVLASAGLNKDVWSTHYDVEPVPNIPMVRNRALKIALAQGASLIAVVDDDEVVSPQWLVAHLEALITYSADISYGPVKSIFPPETPSWLQSNPYFNRRTYPTGGTLTFAYTHNVLLRRKVADRVGFFDETWGLKGGEDSHYFIRAYQQGFRIIGCKEAVVFENVPQERTCIFWLLKRAFRLGNTVAIRDLKFSLTMRQILPRFFVAIRRAGWVGLRASFLTPLQYRKTPGRLLILWQKVFFELGRIWGWCGGTYQPYKVKRGAN